MMMAKIAKTPLKFASGQSHRDSCGRVATPGIKPECEQHHRHHENVQHHDAGVDKIQILRGQDEGGKVRSEGDIFRFLQVR